jgi:chaperone LolA
MSQPLLFIITFFVFTLSGAKESSDKTLIHAATKKEMALIKASDHKYQKEHGIHIKIKKIITLGMLGSTKESEGEVWLSKGKLRLEINKPEVSKIIADTNYLWIESPAPEGFEDTKTQVLKASLKSTQAKAQGLIQLLTQGGVLKYFKVSGVKKEKENTLFFLQPINSAIEFKRAQIDIDNNSKVMNELKYWDQMDNETSYRFLKTDFNETINDKKFEYTPPANAEVIAY